LAVAFLLWGRPWFAFRGGAVKEDWEVVAEIPEDALRKILKEEGIPEEDMEKEVEKLQKNAQISIGIRAVLITPEVDDMLKALVSEAFQQGVITEEAFQRARSMLWPQ